MKNRRKLAAQRKRRIRKPKPLPPQIMKRCLRQSCFALFNASSNWYRGYYEGTTGNFHPVIGPLQKDKCVVCGGSELEDEVYTSESPYRRPPYLGSGVM